MDKQMPKFTPESVDEQLDQLLAHHLPASQNAEFIADLSQMYQDDERSLARVRQNLGLENEQPISMTKQPGTVGTALPTSRPASAKIHHFERNRPMHQKPKRSLARTLTLLAAAPNTQQQTKLPPGIYTSDANHVFRLNTQTQQVYWQQTVKNVSQILPAGNVVYILVVSQTTPGPLSIAKLDANSGKLLWEHVFFLPKADPNTTTDVSTTNLVLSQNRLYLDLTSVNIPSKVSSKQQMQATNVFNQLYVLNTSNGSQQAAYPNIAGSSLAVGNGVIVVGSQHALQAYNATDGKLLWQVSLAGGLNEPVKTLSMVNNLIYAVISNSTQDIAGKGQSSITSYNLNGKQVWQSPTFSSDALSQFTVNQNVIYFGTLDNVAANNAFTGHVYAYNIQSNKQLWSKKVDGGAQEPLIVSNGLVYTVADSGSHERAHLVALDTTTGTIKWQQTLSGAFLDNFAVSNGIIYISSNNAGLNTPAPVQIDARDANTGKVLWEDAQHGTSNITPTE